MTDEDLFLSLYRLHPYAKRSALVILDRYICDFEIRREDEYRELAMFTPLCKDSNSCAKQTYANLVVFDSLKQKAHYGRLYMSVNEDLGETGKYAFMLFLNDNKQAEKWLTSIALPANSIKLLSNK